MTNLKINNIVFDLGNVLLTFDPRRLMERLTGDPRIAEWVYRAVIQSPEWRRLDSGLLTIDTARAIYLQRHPDMSEPIRMFFEHWLEMFQPIAETVPLIEELRQRGYKLYVLSNFIRESFEYVSSLPRFDFLNRFDGIVVSFELGMAKPDIEIYRHLIETYQLNPEETLFIDDLKQNVEGAKEAGLRTIHFVSDQQLRQQLREMNIIPDYTG